VSDLIKAAIAGLSIDVPIYRTVENDGVLLLYLYGGRVERWPPSHMEPAGAGCRRDRVTTDDFAVIPGVGKAITAALHTAGFLTFQHLDNASDVQILAVPKLTAYALSKIRSYLYTHHP